MRETRAITAAVVAVCAGLSASAQCTYQTSLLDTWDRVGTPTIGDAQHAQNGWTFRRSDSSALLVGVFNAAVGVNGWGAPDQSFVIPLIGPRYSHIPGRNQSNVFRRTPSFEGLLLHPGNTAAVDASVMVHPQATLTLNGLSLQIEHLGNSSPNAIVRVDLVTPGGTTALIPATSIPKLAAAQILVPSSGLPVVLAPGDVIHLAADSGGSAFEDWLNANLVLDVAGAPLIVAQPEAIEACLGSTVILRVVAAGAASYQWRRGGVEMSGEVSATLAFPAISLADVGEYDCVVTNACDEVVTASASVGTCAANYNCDAEVDILDFLDFFDDFGSCENQPAPCGVQFNADVNGDTFVDILDFLDFLDAFGTGCI